MDFNSFSVLFGVAVLAMVGLEIWLTRRQGRHVLAHRDAVPAAFAETIPLAAHQKAADYTLAKGAFKRGEGLYSAAILLIWTFGGALGALYGFWQGWGLSAMSTGVLFLLSFLAISALLEWPSTYYRMFVTEQRFGFNRATRAIFFTDQSKEIVLTLVIGAPLVAVTLWLMNSTGPYWWVFLWLAWMAFALFMMWAYPAFVAPLFNKFTPLDDAALQQRVEQLLQRCGFASQGIFVMDGSRRSGHGNAYFTGVGNNKRIVFFDTLLNTLNPDQIEAVLAHELGHFRCKHVVKNMLTLALLSLLGLAFLGWASAETWFYTGLGVSEQNTALALALFLLVVPVFTFFLRPMMTALSRRFEFEADAYAASVANAEDLIDALVALYQENASTLTPDPLVSAVYDSHPPAAIRIAELKANLQSA